MKIWDAVSIAMAALWTALAIVVLYTGIASAQTYGGCRTLVIQDGIRLKTCVICEDAYGNIISIRCF